MRHRESRVARLTRPESKESKGAAADSEKNPGSQPGIRSVAFSRQGIQLIGSRSILTGLLVNSRPTVIRGLMSDEGATGGDIFTIPAAGGKPVPRRGGRLGRLS